MKTKYLFLLLFFFSGVAGLGYEILWTRMLAVGLGHEIVSMLAVVSAFFSGIALGAWVFALRVNRSSDPARWYVGFELVIALWAVVLLFIIPQVTPWVSALLGLEPSSLHHWTLAFLYPFLLLLPATAAMGGTLPAMDRLFRQLNRNSSVAGLYSANTFGAMAGTLGVTFVILPALGMAGTSLLLAAANILGAAGVLLLSRRLPVPVSMLARGNVSAAATSHPYLILFCTGLLGIGFEVVMVRVLNQLLENTVYSFAVLLAVYLFGTAAGAALYQRYGRQLSFDAPLAFLLNCTALFCLGSILLLGSADTFFAFAREFFGKGFRGSVSAELTLALAIFFLPTLAMGATFSHLAQHLRNSDGGIGRALCLNTLGGACAPVILGLWLIPAAGLKLALLLVAAGYLLLMPRACLRCRPMPVAAAVIGTFIILHPFDFRFVTLAEEESLTFHREGVMASVAVVTDSNGEAHLKVDNHFQMGGTTSMYSDRRETILPLLLHRKPESALFLGLGTGVTFAAAADYPGLQADGVELIPEVIEAMSSFAKANKDLTTAKNLRVINADARRFVTVTPKKYDVVIADLFHPARDGAASLYTVEHFTAIRNLLKEDGLFCQWLPLYQMDTETLRVIMKTFLQVFPEGQAYLAHYSLENPIIGLVGSVEPLRYPERWFRTKLQDEQVRNRTLTLKYDSFYSLFGTFLAGSDRLRAFCGASPLNTDDQPVVMFRAPHFVYGDPAPAGERLLALVNELSPPAPEEILAPPITEEDYLVRDRLLSYWDARNSFLGAGMKIARTSNVKRLYETAREPLLAVIRKSLDFSAAYFPLLAIAYELFPQDREASYQLFSDLMRANPMRREAYLMRRNLFDEQIR